MSYQFLFLSITPVVASDNTIGVEHMYDFENKIIPQVLCFVIIGHQEL